MSLDQLTRLLTSRDLDITRIWLYRSGCDWANRCCECNQKIDLHELFIRTREKVSIMRGDDEIKWFCVSCADSVGVTPPVGMIENAVVQQYRLLCARIQHTTFDATAMLDLHQKLAALAARVDVKETA